MGICTVPHLGNLTVIISVISSRKTRQLCALKQAPKLPLPPASCFLDALMFKQVLTLSNGLLVATSKLPRQEEVPVEVQTAVLVRTLPGDFERHWRCLERTLALGERVRTDSTHCVHHCDGHSTAVLVAKRACTPEVSHARFYVLVAGSHQES